MMGPMMAAGMGLNRIGQVKGIQTLEIEQLGNNLLLSFIGTGAATLLTQLPVVGTLMTIGGVVFVSDMALGAAMTGAVGLAELGDVQGTDMDTYRLGRKAWDLVLKERNQGMSFLSNLSYLSYRSNFLGNAVQLEKDAAQKETQLKNDVQEFLDTTFKQALFDATDKKTGKINREKFSRVVTKALWQIRQEDQLNTDLVYLICDVEKEDPLNQLFTQAFIPQANWEKGVRQVQITSPENVDLLINYLNDDPSHQTQPVFNS